MLKWGLRTESGLISLNGERIPFSISRSRRRKHTIAFKMERDGSLLVLAPMWTFRSTIEKVLHKRAAWITRECVAQKKNDNKSEEFTDGSAFFYLGYPCALRVTEGKGAPSSCVLSRRVLRVHVHEEGLSPDGLRQEVKMEILLWIKKRAREKLKKRIDYWANRLGVKYKKFVLTNPKSRWGSCSRDNVVRLNWRLMMAPLPILDYVVAHELSHIRHKNHSASFWTFLAERMPDHKERRKVLRRLERSLM